MCRKYYILYLLLLVCIFTACAPRSIREAQSVVAQADSLWLAGKLYGMDEGDSATLAQAYKTLEAIPLPFREGLGLGSPYAHACYHYGKLLRAKENPVEAMQVFIAATHSGTKDYHILGRVYSNIGSICHLAGEFPLSYDMYERSANCFLTDNDSLSYYFLLNDMAYELAEQGKKDSAFMVLEQIDRTKIDSYAIMKIFETKAEACLYAHMYDSAIYYTSPLLSYSYTEPEWLLIRAQAYSLNGENDSAVYYANRALSITNEIYHQNNALYILTNNDTTKDIEAVRVVAADRADVQKLIEIKRSKCAQAVQYLEQNLNAERNITWLYAIISTVVIIGIGIVIYRKHQKRRHALLSQHIDELVTTNEAMQQRQAQILKEQTDYIQNKIAQIEQNCLALYTSEDFPANICWKDYDKMCEIINEHCHLLVSKLQTVYHLSEKEIRLCVAVIIGISNSELLADMLYYGYSGIRNFKNRTAKKLGTNSVELRDVLMHIAVGDYPNSEGK